MEDRLQVIFQNVNEWLKFAEAKNAGLLVVNATTVFAALQLRLGDKPLEWWGEFYLEVFVLFTGAACLAAIASFLPQISMPELPTQGEPVSTDNLLFFGDIAKYSPDEYAAALGRELGGAGWTPSGIEPSYIGQIIANSRIAARKYRYFNWAMWLTVYGVVTPPVAFALQAGLRRFRAKYVPAVSEGKKAPLAQASTTVPMGPVGDAPED